MQTLVANDGIFTPKNILELTNNCPNLEAISFCVKIGRQTIDQMKHAFDTFFNARKVTLKSFALSKSYRSGKDSDVNFNSLLENLILCQNMEEIWITRFELEDATLKDIMNLPKIKRLVLNTDTSRISFPLSFIQEHSFTNLRYLKLNYNWDRGNLYTFGNMKFPVLERFAIHIHWMCPKIDFIEAEEFTTDIYQLVANSPKLKSIQLHGKIFHIEANRNMSLQLCRDRTIFITFGTFTHEVTRTKYEKYQKFQNEFEKMIEDNDTMTKTKYHELKRNFVTWEKMNNWWTWAVEDQTTF